MSKNLFPVSWVADVYLQEKIEEHTQKLTIEWKILMKKYSKQTLDIVALKYWEDRVGSFLLDLRSCELSDENIVFIIENSISVKTILATRMNYYKANEVSLIWDELVEGAMQREETIRRIQEKRRKLLARAGL